MLARNVEKQLPNAADVDDQDSLLSRWILAIGGLLTLAIAGPALARLVYATGDLGAFHLPMRAFYSDCLRRGLAFDWMPGIFCGLDFTGEGQGGPYHPWHLVLYRTLPLQPAFALELVTSYPMMFAGTFLFLKRLDLPRHAALFGALVFTFSGFNLLHFQHPNAIAIVAHLPWLLWAIDRVLRSEVEGERRAGAIAVALLTGSQILLGYPQYVWLSLLAESAWAALLCARSGHARRLLLIGQAEVVGVLLGAVQWIPTLDALQHSQRYGFPQAFAAMGSLHPANILQLIAPYATPTRVWGENTHELGLYAGEVPVVLLVWLATRKREPLPADRWIAPVFTFALCCLWLAFGGYGGTSQLLCRVPLIGSFRIPARHIVLIHLCIAVLAAIAWAALASETRAARPTSLGPLWRLVVLSILIAALMAVAGGDLGHRRVVAIAIGPTLIATATWLIALATRGRRWALVALAVLMAVDIGTYGLGYSVYRDLWHLPLPDGTSILPSGSTRIAVQLPDPEEPRRIGDALLLQGFSLVDGYAGLEPARVLDYHDLTALRLAGVGLALRETVEGHVAGLRPHDELWLAVPDPFPRVRLVTHVRQSDEPARDLQAIDPTTTALVTDPLELSGGEAGDVSVREEVPGALQIAADVPSRQLLVVADRFDPGWQGLIDGRSTEVLRVYRDFIGIVLDAGRHLVSLRFAPASVRLGRWLSCSGLIPLGLLLVRWLRASPSRARP